MPGLLRGIARTAVVAGTATAVSGRVQRRQAERFAERDASIYAQQDAAYAAQQNAAYAAPAPTPLQAEAPSADERLEQLRQLGELRAQGVLTEAEFAVEKARILS
jgi:hypothetical protein